MTQLEEQLEFSFMPDVLISCYNGMQFKYMRDIYFGSKDYFLNPRADKKPSAQWIELYFQSHYAHKKAQELREIYFGDRTSLC